MGAGSGHLGCQGAQSLFSALDTNAEVCYYQHRNRRRGSYLMADPDELSIITQEPFSEAIIQFGRLINSCDALAFLLGAGCSKCAGLPLTRELTQKVLQNSKIDCLSKEILTAVEDIFVDAIDANIEDYLSEIADLIAITDRRAGRGVKKNTVAVGNIQYNAEQLRKASNQIKRAIASAIGGKVNITTHQHFIKSVHQPTRVGRPASAHPVDYLVLNYDTTIEDALALEKIPYADGLYGGTTGWWDSNAFEANALSARVIKLHGSIDWRQFPNEQSPRRVGPSVETSDGVDLPVLIWPSSTKYLEAQLDPFAQLLDLARKAMRPPDRSQRLLIICGYSFSDSHINLELDRALKEAGRDLTIAVFTDGNEPTGQLKDWCDDHSVREQVLVFANRGFFHAENKRTSPHDLPWWKFENLTKILRGEV